MGRLFGTDGIRGIANTELSCSLAMEVAKVTGTVVSDDLGHPATFIVGSDTRISAGMLEAAINAGFCSVGVNVINIGFVPTPAVSYLITQGYGDAGIMISASHNPFDFNGIKVFGTDGNKLSDEQEFLIEKFVKSEDSKPYSVCWRDDIGKISRKPELLDYYTDYLASTVEEDLSGLKIALDCSNGSACMTAKKLFDKLGIKTDIIANEPNGVNINKDCGSTHIEKLGEFVKAGSYDAGFAFDGDADRCLMVDENGKIHDGDTLLAILALDMSARGKLKDNTLVATVMSNMGLFEFGRNHSITVEQTKVGDRYVLEKMQENDFRLGGEQSGHVILKEYMSTGDGQLTAISTLAALKRSGKKMSELSNVINVYPQVIKNIKADSAMKANLASDPAAQKIIDKAAEKLGDEGRILVRPSGTEPLIRVMIEGKNISEIEELVNKVSDELYERLKYTSNL